MSFNTILPGAWSLTQDVNYQLFALPVPIAWQQIAKSLAVRRARLQGKGYQAPPVYSLDRLVAASFPKIIQTVRQGWQKPSQPWLLAEERIADLSLLALLIKDWLREEFSSSLGTDEVEASLATLNAADWQWEQEPRTYSLLHPQTREEESVLYNAIPDFLAKEFLKNPTVQFGGQELTFYRVIRLGGAELMSWPPHPVTIPNRDGEAERAYLSFVLQFALQTVPGRKSPIMYHHLSTRRWIIKSRERPPYRGLTAYIGNELRLLDGVRQPLCFIPLSMKRRGETAGWSKAIEALLADDTRLPNAIALLENPAYHWNAFETTPMPTQAAIAFDSRHSQSSSGAISQPGPNSFDLACIDQEIRDRLPVERVGEAVRVGGSVKFLGLPATQPKLKNVTQATSSQSQPSKRRKVKKTDSNTLSTPMLRPSIAAPAVFRSTNPIQEILIIWETVPCRDELIAEICQLLCLSATGEAINYTTTSHATGQAQRYEGSFGSLWIKTQHVEDLTQDLDLVSIPPRERQQRRVQLLQERIDRITSFLPTAKGLSGALIEIKRRPFLPEADPKLAWRIAAMQAGYLNQHIHALIYKKDALERVKRAVSDLLRQCGVLPDAPLIQPSDRIEPHVWLTCFYVLRRTRRTTASNLPNTVVMMIRVNAIEPTLEVTTPSLLARNRTNRWVSYPSALNYFLGEKWDPSSQFEEINTQLNEEQSFSEKDKEEALLNKFVSECLQTCLHEPIAGVKPHVLFMAEAQNARRKGLLSWLQNPNLEADRILSALHLKDEDERNRLWIARLRLQGSSYETPVAIVKPGSTKRAKPGSRARGAIYCWQGVSEGETPVYFSIRQASANEQYPLKISESRLSNGSRSAINARLLEVAIVHHPGIQPDQLALLVHRLRNRFPYYADDSSLPFPFSFADKAKEYAVSARDSVELDDLEQDEDV